MRKVALLLGGLCAVPAAIQAQECVGQASWTSGNIKVGGSVEFGSGSTLILGGLGFGKGEAGPFFGVAGGFVSGGGVTREVVQGSLGFELKKPVAKGLELCPIGSFTAGFGHGVTTLTPLGGISLGYPVDIKSKNVVLVLTGAAQIGLTHESGGGASATDGFGLLDAGVGFIFNDKISLVPVIRIPIASEGGEVSFAVRANVAVGKKR